MPRVSIMVNRKSSESRIKKYPAIKTTNAIKQISEEKLQKKTKKKQKVKKIQLKAQGL